MSRFSDFAALHVAGDPLVLFNVWDAGSAKVVAETGARAIATGSHPVADALGYPDGEKVPLDLVIANLERVVKAVDLPVTLDFEGGYDTDPARTAQNVLRVHGAGAVGINFEDQVIGGQGLHAIDAQAKRIAAIRAAVGSDFFINARTDAFMKATEAADRSVVDDAIARGRAYADAGASGFFIPGQRDPAILGEIVAAVPLPVNFIAPPGSYDKAAIAATGVARISHGPFPLRIAMAALKDAAAAAL